jgi:hypothetical protein
MKTKGTGRTGLVVMLGLLLTACGGGGDKSGGDGTVPPPSDTVLSPVQQNAQEAYSAGIYSVSASLPASGAPTPGMHYAYSTRFAISAALSTTPQRLLEPLAPLSPNLPLPSFVSWTGGPALVNGNIYSYARTDALADRVWLEGTGVVSDSIATDGVTVLPGVLYTSFDPLPLSGALASAPLEVRTWQGLSAFFSNAALLKPNASFAAGAGYVKRKAVRRGDAVFLNDCGASTGTTPSPCGTAAAISAVFPHTYGSTTYIQGDGTLQTLQGLTAWVSSSPVSSSVSPTTAYLVFVERGGSVYRGLLQRDGTTMRTLLPNGSLVDYSIRLNQKALESLQAAVTF